MSSNYDELFAVTLAIKRSLLSSGTGTKVVALCVSRFSGKLSRRTKNICARHMLEPPENMKTHEVNWGFPFTEIPLISKNLKLPNQRQLSRSFVKDVFWDEKAKMLAHPLIMLTLKVSSRSSFQIVSACVLLTSCFKQNFGSEQINWFEMEILETFTRTLRRSWFNQFGKVCRVSKLLYRLLVVAFKRWRTEWGNDE